MATTGGNGYAPAEFPPPVDVEAEFIAKPEAGEDEAIEVGVAIVGGGPAGLACANKLLQLLAEDEELLESLGEVPVAIIEKGKVCGAHNLSGAVMKPGPFKSIFPDADPDNHPAVEHVAKKDDALWFRNAKSVTAMKPTPPNFANKGNWVISISQLSRWMAEQAEEAGAYVLTETAAQQLLVEDGVVKGVKTGDKGRGKEGEELSSFEPGVEVQAKATVLAEGTWGHLTDAAVKHFNLADGKEPPVWKLGVKEIWKVSKPFESIVHFFGWPGRGDADLGESSTGGWIYPLGEDKVSIGLLVPLHTKDATVSAHDMLQTLKGHPYFEKLLDGGEREAWGAKAVQVGGYYSMPKLSAPGMVLCGESGGMFDMVHIKGVHLAIQSGILAAEQIYAQLKAGGNDYSGYEQAIENDAIVGKSLQEARNFAQLQGSGGMVKGMVLGGINIVSKGKLLGGRKPHHRDTETKQELIATPMKDLYPTPDGKRYFDKLSSVFITGNATRDDAPNHIRIEKHVPREVAETWRWMCPAGVYEIPEDAPETGEVDVIVNYTNCVQCGAITARGGRLTPPEGGDGPLYTQV
ncbi:MAG: electron-transfer flavoprotein:ubiquinone oxidoreductase [Baekduia sp.]